MALNAALVERDSHIRAPAFRSLLAPRRAPRLGLAYAAGAATVAIVLFAIVVVRPPDESAGVDLALAAQLSSPDYWRGPTDRLIAQTGSGGEPVLPVLPTYEMSLEDSWL
jgi:hypothetical protein